jgi:uncharacterized protein (TIGR00730 family)
MSRSITVFCSSSPEVDAVYAQAAAELGRGIAAQGWRLIYGGNNLGTMGALADGCRGGKGCVIGITPQLFVDKGFADTACDELIITPDMRSRRARMEEMADAFVTLPGGFGTLEEISEILVSRLLRCHEKPVVIVNINGFYSPLLELFGRMIAGGFAREQVRGCYQVAGNVGEALAILQGALRGS